MEQNLTKFRFYACSALKKRWPFSGFQGLVERRALSQRKRKRRCSPQSLIISPYISRFKSAHALGLFGFGAHFATHKSALILENLPSNQTTSLLVCNNQLRLRLSLYFQCGQGWLVILKLWIKTYCKIWICLYFFHAIETCGELDSNSECYNLLLK